MPWGDRTGPWGLGPMTGRGAGYCAGYPVPGYANPYLPGWGARGGGWGRGRGHRWWYRATGVPGWARYGYYGYPSYGGGYASSAPMPWGQAPTREQEAEFLKSQQDALQQQLDEIKAALDELAAEPEK